MVRRALRSVCATVGALAVATGSAAAHVDYVTEDTAPGSAAELFAAVMSSPLALALLAGGGATVAVAALGYLRFSASLRDVEVARRTLASYRPYLPWMLRLSVGLPLVGAGFSGYLFSPTVTADARLLQVGIGFLLLFGLLTRVVAAVGLLAYFWALAGAFPELLLASEYVAGFLGIFVVGPGQPSADMMLRRIVAAEGTLLSRFRGFPKPEDVLSELGLTQGTAPLLIRVFLGANFVYLGVVQKWFQPAQAAAVVEKYGLTGVVPVSPELWIFGAGLTEAVVGVFLLTGTFTRGTATAAFVILTTTLFGLPDDPVLAHVTLFGLSSALMVTGAGALSLDGTVIPALRRRIGAGVGGAERPAV
ncbi:DoxX family protein [Halobellus rubicundus]|uniref:DoxX family protein n=1 Tax=Halobellus rubicundus TaxID=2996466 RepID=A0ABD5MCC7_9EURY